MDNDKLNETLTQILNKIDNLEKTYVSINADLINQNIKMCEILNGKLQEPDFEMPEINDNKKESSENSEQRIKELFYYEKNGKIIVHGPGTYDNRPILKQYGEWNSLNKSWDLIVSKETLLEKIPNIIEKVKT